MTFEMQYAYLHLYVYRRYISMYVSIHTQTYMWCTYINTQSPAGSFAHVCAYAPTDAVVCTDVSTCMFTYAYEG